MSLSPRTAFCRLLLLLFAVRDRRGCGLFHRAGGRRPAAVEAAGCSRRRRHDRLALHVQGSLRAERSKARGSSSSTRSRAAGFSLVDTKDAALRQKLIAAGYHGALRTAGLHARPAGAGDRPCRSLRSRSSGSAGRARASSSSTSYSDRARVAGPLSARACSSARRRIGASKR